MDALKYFTPLRINKSPSANSSSATFPHPAGHARMVHRSERTHPPPCQRGKPTAFLGRSASASLSPILRPPCPSWEKPQGRSESLCAQVRREPPQRHRQGSPRQNPRRAPVRWMAPVRAPAWIAKRALRTLMQRGSCRSLDSPGRGRSCGGSMTRSSSLQTSHAGRRNAPFPPLTSTSRKSQLLLVDYVVHSR